MSLKFEMPKPIQRGNLVQTPYGRGFVLNIYTDVGICISTTYEVGVGIGTYMLNRSEIELI